MKLERLPHDPAALADFYQQGLEHLGALCERTWHNRLQVVAEGSPARLWNSDGALHEIELHFPPAQDTAPRDAAREVFPGCPLTFALAEVLHPHPLPLERAVVTPGAHSHPPSHDVAEKLWRAQRPGTVRWRPETPFALASHFSLIALVRCEIQAIDQHWSLHRIALSLPDGQPDEALASQLGFHNLTPDPAAPIRWPPVQPAQWSDLFRAALAEELRSDLAAISARQENYLRRELDRVDHYFQNYERELTQRAARATSSTTKMKTADRLAATRAEHARRRQDQLQRHEIRVIPHFDALLLLAEPAWQATVWFLEQNRPRTLPALFVPRTRRWVVSDES